MRGAYHLVTYTCTWCTAVSSAMGVTETQVYAVVVVFSTEV